MTISAPQPTARTRQPAEQAPVVVVSTGEAIPRAVVRRAVALAGGRKVSVVSLACVRRPRWACPLPGTCPRLASAHGAHHVRLVVPAQPHWRRVQAGQVIGELGRGWHRAPRSRRPAPPSPDHGLRTNRLVARQSTIMAAGG